MGTAPVQGDEIALGDPYTSGTSQAFGAHLLSSRITFFWGSVAHRMKESSFSSSNFGMRLI